MSFPTVDRPAGTTGWDVAVGTGLLRLGVGAALLRWRDPLIRLGGGSPDDAVLRALFTYFGVRDLAVGVSTLVATRPGRDVRRQLHVQGVADAGDAVVLSTLVSSGRLPRLRGWALAGLAGGTAVLDYALSRRVTRRS